MKQIHRTLPLLLTATVTLAVAGLALAVGETGSKPYHADPRIVEEAVVAASGAFVREDPGDVRHQLDRVKRNCRELKSEEEGRFGSTILRLANGFQVTLDRARESGTRGNLEDAFDQLVWVQRTCVSCHRQARERGLLPPKP